MRSGEGRAADERAIGKLQALVRLPTISYADDGAIDHAMFHAQITELELLFPLLHQHLTLTRIEQHSLLFHWQGHASDRPVVLMAHQDVVPVDPQGPWQHPPFAGTIADDALWGRGTLDDKGSLVGICEAVERLLERGFTPAQDIWLSFGAREEVSGADARVAAETLAAQGVRPWFVLDEGGAIAHDAFPGVKPPLGVFGVTEKGTTTVRLSASGRGGHSSTPARNGPTTRIARAVLQLEKHPFPGRLPAPTIEMFRRIAPHAPIALRPLMTHAARLKPALIKSLQLAGPEPAALTRTTMAVTMLEGSPAHNVIAASATAVVNLRVLVGDTVESAIAHVRKAIGDKKVEIELVEGNEPSPISPVDDDAFRLLQETTEELFEDAVVTPYVMMAATDARYFTTLCTRVYRFTPFRMTKAQRESIHSHDERIGLDDFARGVDWYELLIQRIGA